MTDDFPGLSQAICWWAHLFILCASRDRNHIYFAPRSRLDDFAKIDEVDAALNVLTQDT